MVDFDSALKMSYDSGFLRSRILYHLKYSMGKKLTEASNNDLFRSISLAVRELIIDGMFDTQDLYNRTDPKRVYCLSLEYLIGRSLTNNLINLGIFDLCREALKSLGVDLCDIAETESDPALGNGGLGRLAACFWIRWRRSVYRDSAMALIMTTGSLNRTLSTAIRWSIPTTGWAKNRRGSSKGPTIYV